MRSPRSRFGRRMGKLVQRALRKGVAKRLARPGEKSDSWATTGMPRSQPAKTTGKLTKPPLEKMASGAMRPSSRWLCQTPRSTENRSAKLRQEK